MKQLLLIRHAKSSWADAGMEDIDRPLNERGKNDAPEMARRLLKKQITIDAFISSVARRAQKTCALFMNEMEVEKDRMIVQEELYLAPSALFYEIIPGIDDQFKTVAVFAHNPGITDFANSLTNVKVDDMPTCSVYAVTIDTNSWSNFADAEKRFWFFDYPKKENTG